MRTPTRDDRRPRNHLEHLATPAVFCGPAKKAPLCPSRPSPKGARPEAPREIYGQASSVSPTEPSRASASDVRPRTVRQRSHRCIPTRSGCLSPTRRSDRSSSATNYAGKAPPSTTGLAQSWSHRDAVSGTLTNARRRPRSPRARKPTVAVPCSETKKGRPVGRPF